jgi:hypothetical protein
MIQTPKKQDFVENYLLKPSREQCDGAQGRGTSEG